MILSFASLGKTINKVPSFTDILLSLSINSLLTPIGNVLVNTALFSSYFKPHNVTPSAFVEQENTDTYPHGIFSKQSLSLVIAGKFCPSCFFPPISHIPKIKLQITCLFKNTAQLFPVSFRKAHTFLICKVTPFLAAFSISVIGIILNEVPIF